MAMRMARLQVPIMDLGCSSMFMTGRALLWVPRCFLGVGGLLMARGNNLLGVPGCALGCSGGFKANRRALLWVPGMG